MFRSLASLSIARRNISLKRSVSTWRTSMIQPKAVYCPLAAAIASHQDAQSFPSSNMALAAAATAAILASFSAASSDSRLAKSEAIVHHNEHRHHLNPEDEMLALGKSLKSSHERMMVQMAKLLRSLEALAEEADDQGKKIQYNDNTADIESSHATQQGKKRFIHITEKELANLSSGPEAVWVHIDALKSGSIYGRQDVKRIVRAATMKLLEEPSLIDLSERCRAVNKKKCKDGKLKTVTVVGDLHGHLEDSLVKILDMVGGAKSDDGDSEGQCGSPWDGTGAVVFNGDFVDRGKNPIEVILAIFLLKLAYPNNVYLNRGNHEDSNISTVYGTRDVLQARYGGKNGVQDMWRAFENSFAALPLAVKTDNAAIMHGGLPCADFTLDQIAQITPSERYKIKTMVNPKPGDHTCELVRDILWSDPRPQNGISFNEDRGCGVLYGPDVVRNFLKKHGLKYLIRSHEPLDAGYELVECDQHGMSLVTVFSAASFPAGEGFNNGAIARLHCDKGGDVTFLTYGEGKDDRGLTTKELTETFKALANTVTANRAALEKEFASLAKKTANRIDMQLNFGDTRRTWWPKIAATSTLTPHGNDAVLITPEQWADGMNYVLSADLPNVDWLNMRKFVAPGDLINYKRFLNLQGTLSNASRLDDKTRNTMLRNHEAVFKVFRFLDSDGVGKVGRADFCKVINELKKQKTHSELSFDAEALFDSIDVAKSGFIKLEDFRIAFRECDVPYHVAVMMSFDKDKSGTIDRNEFREGVKLLNARLALDKRLPETNNAIDRLFDELDDNGDGELVMSEFEKFVRDHVH